MTGRTVRYALCESWTPRLNQHLQTGPKLEPRAKLSPCRSSFCGICNFQFLWLRRVHPVLAFICCFGFLLSHNSTECHGEQVPYHWVTGQFCFLLMKGLKNDFVRNILWTFEDIHMLVGSNMPIFGGGRYPAVSLRLRWVRSSQMFFIPALTGYSAS